MSAIRDRIRKVRRLMYESPIPGERRAARARLDELRRRYPEAFAERGDARWATGEASWDARSAADDTRWDEAWLIRYLGKWVPQRQRDWIETAVELPDGRYRLHPSAYPDLCRFFAWDGPLERFGTARITDMGKAARDLLLHRKDYLLECWRNRELEALKAMAPYMDIGWSGMGLKPSELLIIRYCITATRVDGNAFEHETRAKAMAREWVEEGRRRWKAGFTAYPEGDPVSRPAAASRSAAA